MNTLPTTLFTVTAGVLGVLAVAWLVRSLLVDRAKGRKRCPGCWYDMRGSESLTCPECGRVSRDRSQLLRTRRHWKQAACAVLLLLAAVGVARTPDLMRNGAWGLIPDPALNWYLSQYPRESAENLEKLIGNSWQLASRMTTRERLLAAWEVRTSLRDARQTMTSNPDVSTPDVAVPSVLQAAWHLGREGRPAINEIEWVLREGHEADVTFAGSALGSLADAGNPRAIRALIAAASSDLSAERRTAAIRGMSAAATDSPRVFRSLCALAHHDPDEAIRCEAIMSLGSLGPPLLAALPIVQSKQPRQDVRDALTSCLEDASPRVRVVAIEQLAGDESVLPPLLKLARNDENESVRLAAHRAVFRTQWKPGEAPFETLTTFLIDCLNDTSRSIRTESVTRLGFFGEHGRHAIDPIIRMLRDREMTTSVDAAEPAIDSLIRLSASPEQTLVSLFDAPAPTRIAVAEAFARRVMQRVNDQDSSARLVDPTHDSEQEQARSLDPSGIPAADLCRLMLTDPEERVSAALCDVARRLPLTPPDAVAIARELAIHHDSWLVQSAAIRLLESARPVEAATVDVLITLLSSTDEKRQRLAALALGLLGDSATPALPALRAALESADPVTKLNAAEAISKIEAAIARTPPAPDDASDTDQPPSQRRG